MAASISLHRMDVDGQQSRYSEDIRGRFGAKYGTGYCEGGCPRDIRVLNGRANAEGWQPSNSDRDKGIGEKGSCCPHVEIFTGNSKATSMAAHPCRVVSMTMCNLQACKNICDNVGCEFNPYRMDQRDFFGPGKVIDTKKKFTVVTQFLMQGGRLSEIKRRYIQGGITIENVASRNLKING